jgi:4-amino-4-deoxy-L-arabinose transferase-like glycosyltransferase
MSVAATANEPDLAVPPGKALGILAAATIACLVPFINKAFCVDDPLFLWAAAQIQAHPLDFYGCEVNWYGTVQPLYDVMKNPPLACYYLSAAAALVGTSEPALHAAFLLPAIGAVWGTWFLARSFCRQPVSAALVALVTPALLVSSTNVMCDTLLVCLWTWAIALWIRGLNLANGGWLAAASLLIAAAALTKYFAVSLIPLLAVYTILRERKPTWRLAWLLVPTALLAGYQWWTWRQYGRGLLSDAAAFAWQIAAIPGTGPVVSQETVGSKTIAGLSFLGGSFIPLLFCAPWLWPKRGLVAATVAGLAIGAWARWVSSSPQLTALHMQSGFTSTSAAQLGLFTLCGALVLWLAMSDIVKHESADACLLALWVWGTFGFAAFVNWTCNVRSVLPIAPALGILLVRRIDLERTRRGGRPVAWRWALVPAAAVALMVAWADFCLANSARTAATQIAAVLRPESGTVWFQGHWGFQYYMRAKGGREVDLSHPGCKPGDILINPFNNTDVYFFDAEFLDPLRELEFPACGWLSTVRERVGAGFYAAIWGPLPFVFAPVPQEKYGIWRLKLPVEFKPLLRDEG